jgi:hypothetical protein
MKLIHKDTSIVHHHNNDFVRPLHIAYTTWCHNAGTETFQTVTFEVF